MEFRPHRDKDGGVVINWCADRLMDLSSILMKIAMPYALMYEAVLDDKEDEDDSDDSDNCCSVDHNI